MAKVITFSRQFPAYHPMKGRPTYFVEKFLKGRPTTIEDKAWNPEKSLFEQLPLALDLWQKLDPKYHTIRNGKRWKTGDYFSPRVWGDDINPKTGKKGPYHSKQIILAPDTLITAVYDIEIKCSTMNGKKSGISAIIINGKIYTDWQELAKNDGLELPQLLDWFFPSAPFSGQIICWNKAVKY